MSSEETTETVDSLPALTKAESNSLAGALYALGNGKSPAYLDSKTIAEALQRISSSQFIQRAQVCAAELLRLRSVELELVDMRRRYAAARKELEALSAASAPMREAGRKTKRQGKRGTG